MTQPTRVGTTIYLLYALLCNAATYLASVVKQAMREYQQATFAKAGPIMLINFAVFILLGLAFYFLGLPVTAVDMAGTLPVSALLIGYLLVGVVEACRRESPRSPEF